MRAAFSNALVRLASADKRVLLLTGDHGYALFDDFRRCCPGQYINAGIAEQNMVGMAAGLARSGFRPFVYGLSAFVPVRVLEQIKLDVAHDNLPVVFLGDGAGFVYSHLGTSHQSTEDIACTRAIPQFGVLSPSDRYEMTWCMDMAYAAGQPVYLRMGKADLGDVHAGPVTAGMGDLIPVRSYANQDLALIATGSMVRAAVDIGQDALFRANIWSAPCLKPIKTEFVESILRRSRLIITLEEHSTYGGLGSLVSEISTSNCPRPVLRIGVADRFSSHCGSYQYLRREHGLDLPAIKQKIHEFASRF